MIGSAFVSQVRRNVPIVGGTVSAISRMRASGMGPGPLGMRETSPIAEAPNRTASSASRTDATQQTLILGGARNISGTVVDYNVTQLHTNLCQSRLAPAAPHST